jgi:hypothetical protein
VILPLRCILTNRHIGDSGACPICSLYTEDAKHLLFMCPWAKELWSSFQLYQLIADASHVERSGSAILENLL